MVFVVIKEPYMSWIDALGVLQIVLVLVFILVLPTYFFLKERWHRQRVQSALLVAESRAAQLEIDMDLLQTNLSIMEQERLNQLRYGARPMDDPPAGARPTLQRLNELWPDDTYTFPIGWEIVQGKPGLVCASVNPDSTTWTGNILLTAKTQFGKDSLAFHILWSLCMRNPVDRLRIVYIDGKQSDGGLWAGLHLAHNLYEPVLGEEGIKAAMQQLHNLRKAREQQRVALRVPRWSDIPLDARPPLVVVFVSELKLLQHGVENESDLEKWLTTELSSALASGILYIVSSQSVSGMKTSWRDQCNTYIAGFQDRDHAVEPNFGMYAKEIEKLGGIVPTHFTGPGYFTARINRSIVSVRTPKLSLDDRRDALAQLPRKPAGLVIPAPTVSEKVSTVTEPATSTVIPAHTNIPGPALPPQKAAFLEGLLTDNTIGMTGTADKDAVSQGMVTSTDTDHTAMEEAIRTALARKEELTDDQIKYLRVVKQLTPTEIAMKLGAVRGDKRTRLDKIYRATGEQREPAAATDSSEKPEKSEKSAQPEKMPTPQSPTFSDPKLVESA
ncbi:MAG: hypothetical protein HC828_10560 [Blastochloris sp.]|nr:hypothetical protein [Blastochloris sp.]